jgi:hypothetical protein
MTLPDGLLIYAENIFRRFPEEFIALGCPNLEKEFDLKNATRRLAETSGSKTVEICLHRIHPDSPNAAVAHADTEADRLSELVTSLTQRCAQLEQAAAPAAAAPPRKTPGAALEKSRPAPVLVDGGAERHAVARPAQPVVSGTQPTQAPQTRQRQGSQRTVESPRNSIRPAPVSSQRIAKEEHEPESPRSPGWFSAWGEQKGGTGQNGFSGGAVRGS